MHTFPFWPHKVQNLRTQNPQWCCLGHCVMSDSFATPWPIAFQASWSKGFPRQEYWSGLLFPSLGDLPDPGIKLMSLAFAGGFFTTETREALALEKLSIICLWLQVPMMYVRGSTAVASHCLGGGPKVRCSWHFCCDSSPSEGRVCSSE